MPRAYRHIDDDLAIVRPEERVWAAVVHAFGWIPVWGFVLNALFWLYFKSRSREMVFHIQQAIQYQIYVLLPVIAYSVVHIVGGVIANLNETVGGSLQMINGFLLLAALTAMAAHAIQGAVTVLVGRPFYYAVFGRKVLEGSIKKIQEG